MDSEHFISCRRSPYIFVVTKHINVGMKPMQKLIDTTFFISSTYEINIREQYVVLHYLKLK